MNPRYIIYVVIALLACLSVVAWFFDEEGHLRPSGREAISDSLITSTYPDLYEVIYKREASGLNPYLSHASDTVQSQAWRALAGTPVDSIETYIQRAKQVDRYAAWFAVSMHEISEKQLRGLEQYWLDEPSQRAGVSLVFGGQGDKETLKFLLNQMEGASGAVYEYDYALAVGRLMLEYEVPGENQLRLIEQAFTGDDPEIICAYLYGYYRGETQTITPEIEGALYNAWSGGLGQSSRVDQYVAKILGARTFYEITMYYNSEKLLDHNIQLGVELAQLVRKLELNERNTLAARILVMHENPHVARQALAGVQGKLDKTSKLFGFITSELLGEDTRTPPLVWLQALETAAEAEPGLITKKKKRLNRIHETRPYFLPQILRIWEKADTPTEYLSRIESMVKDSKPLQSLYALNALSRFWATLPQYQQTDAAIDQGRKIVFQALALEDRGVAFASRDLLGNESLFNTGDFPRINRALSSFDLPEDIEVYQVFGSLYEERFREQARTVIDSLASLGYAPLNRYLQQAGWDVKVPDRSENKFRIPDWDRLWQLGRNPVWVLETEKGVIKVQMHTLTAPATVSAIDSLTTAGLYEGIPFHRVVPNFVIQGGDIERRDGFGGPDFIIPTEASEREFIRGAAGIASAGTDTEGSQFFFMHQWKPHLNGRYTLFGNVIQGMDVVDRIVPGDKVQNAYWEN